MSIAACIQLSSQAKLTPNLLELAEKLKQAAASGAQLALLPEMFFTLNAHHYRALATDNYYTDLLRQWAKEYRLWLVAGAMPSLSSDGRFYSTCRVFDEYGEERAQYHKVHLFDAQLEDKRGRYQESKYFAPGHQAVVLDTPIGRLGLSICFDLRYPHLFQALRAQGAQVLSVPAAFTYQTGQAHWQILLQARAIENQCFVLAANQCGWHDERRQTWGHSQIIDPFGEVLARLEHEPGVLSHVLDLKRLDKVRAAIPMKHKELD